MPRLISASARRSSPRPGRAAPGPRPRPAAAAPPRPPPGGCRAAGPAAARPPRAAPAPARAGRPAPTPTPLRQRQVPLRLRQRSLRQLVGRGQGRELGIGRARLGGEPGQQRVHGGGLPAQVQAGPVIGEQPGGQPPVLRGLGVPDRLHRVPVPGVPPGGRLVQRGDLGRGGAPQPQLQQVGEQTVVAEPGPRRVQRHHERVRLLQLLQDPLAARTPRQGVGQLAVHPLQHAGPQQQPPHLLVLPLQHLGQQVLGHRPFAAGELGREPVRVVVPGQRQRRQPQPCRPPLGPLIQQSPAPARPAPLPPPPAAPAPRPG